MKLGFGGHLLTYQPLRGLSGAISHPYLLIAFLLVQVFDANALRKPATSHDYYLGSSYHL